jgi:hypothetical protein
MESAARSYLAPGEIIQTVFAGQTPHPQVAALRSGLRQFGLVGGLISASVGERTRIWNFVVTDRRILVLEGSYWSATRIKALTAELPRSTRLGPPSGLWQGILADGRKIWVRRSRFDRIRLADSLAPGPPPYQDLPDHHAPGLALRDPLGAHPGIVLEGIPRQVTGRRTLWTVIASATAVVVIVGASAFFLGKASGRQAAPQASPARSVLQPPGDSGWQDRTPKPYTGAMGGTPADMTLPPGVAVSPPSVITSTGARLTWPAYKNTSGYPDNDLVGYEIHRGPVESYAPTAATLLATVSAGQTSFTDATVTPDSNPLGQDWYYMVAARVRSGKLIPGPIRQVRLPPAGQIEIVLRADGDGGMSSKLPDEILAGELDSFRHEPSLDVGNDPHYGITRSVFSFGPLPAPPGGATLVAARFTVSGVAIDTSQYTLYQLNRYFDSYATWNSPALGASWASPGGDYSAPSGGGLPGSGDDPEAAYFDATAIVRGWLASPGVKHEVLLKATQERGSASNEAIIAGIGSSDPGQDPALVITYKQ